MNSIDYHMLSAFRYEAAMLQSKKVITINGDDFTDKLITYIKSRIDELERKLKNS